MKRSYLASSCAAFAFSIFLASNCFAIDKCAPVAAQVRKHHAVTDRAIKKLLTATNRYDRGVIKLLKSHSAAVKSVLELAFAEQRAEKQVGILDTSFSDAKARVLYLQDILSSRKLELSNLQAQECTPDQAQLDPRGCWLIARKTDRLIKIILKIESRLDAATANLDRIEERLNKANTDYTALTDEREAAYTQASAADPNFADAYDEAEGLFESLKNDLQEPASAYETALKAEAVAQAELFYCAGLEPEL